jgi:hypothetical protein
MTEGFVPPGAVEIGSSAVDPCVVHLLELAGAGNHDRDAGTLLGPTARADHDLGRA